MAEAVPTRPGAQPRISARALRSGALAAVLCGIHLPVSALENEKLKEIAEGLESSFAVPVRELFEKKYPQEWRNLAAEFSGNFGFSYPLQTRPFEDSSGSGSEGERATNATFSASLKWKPLGNWFASITLNEYLEPELQRPWNPDFSYVFGYDDWRPYTLSFVYANYGGNRLNPDRANGEHRTRFEQGGFTLAWKLAVPQSAQRWLAVHSTGGLSGSVGVTAAPRYFDLASGETRHWKRSVHLSFKYNIYEWWYINATLVWYPDGSQQQPWDPDFTWGFGYFDWHPGTITVQYNNYSGNRFPWNDHVPGTGRFRDGSISVSWSWSP
ncbi:MAG: hypothetical protein MI919_24150 [Holophagales bacterium]|nr:hypothetical protein [Holophagales bacterium]